MSESTVTPEAFVRTWQTSDSLDEVAKKLNQNKKAVYTRGYLYKTKRRIQLKSFEKKEQPLSWTQLAKLAKDLLKDA